MRRRKKFGMESCPRGQNRYFASFFIFFFSFFSGGPHDIARTDVTVKVASAMDGDEQIVEVERNLTAARSWSESAAGSLAQNIGRG